MEKQFIGEQPVSENALPFALGVRFGSLIFLSGMVSKNLQDGRHIKGTIEEETAQVFENIKALLVQAGSSLDKILKTTVYLADMEDFERMNKVYRTYFKSPAARSTVQAGLVGEFKIEIEVTAYI